MTKRTVTKRTYKNIVILVAVLYSGELWQIWKKSDAVFNGWLCLNYPLSIQWFFKFLFGHELSRVLLAWLIVRLSYYNYHMRIAAKTFFWYSIISLILFFVNFNTVNYIYVYILTNLSLLLVWRAEHQSWKEYIRKMKRIAWWKYTRCKIRIHRTIAIIPKLSSAFRAASFAFYLELNKN